VTVLDGGEIIASGTAEQVKRDPKVIVAYLGVADTAGDVAPAQAG
jgi:ABC-type branched-subunit amino acid transport system ATPase component